MMPKTGSHIEHFTQGKLLYFLGLPTWHKMEKYEPFYKWVLNGVVSWKPV